MARMISISEEDFHRHYWPKLESAINLILQQNPGEFIPISYEETYSAVYKCVCQQHSEKLYENLMIMINNILIRIKDELESQPVDMYLNRFAHIMSQYLQSVEGIAAIFNYMNRFYVKPKKNSELKSELLTLFSASVAENDRLFEILNHSAAQPFSSDPKILMSIVQGLYMLRPEFAEKNVDLFSRFIPNLVGQASSLDQEINDTKVLQQNLRNQEEFISRENLLKRTVDAAEMSIEASKARRKLMTANLLATKVNLCKLSTQRSPNLQLMIQIQKRPGYHTVGGWTTMSSHFIYIVFSPFLL